MNCRLLLIILIYSYACSLGKVISLLGVGKLIRGIPKTEKFLSSISSRRNNAYGTK